MNNRLTADIKKDLLKAQQSKMDTVVIYKYLSEVAKDPEMKATFAKMASDEGKHAGIFRKYTGQTVERKEKPALRFRIMTKIFGLKMVIRLMLTTEQKNVETSAPAAKANPVMRDLLKDGRRHCELLSEMLEKKKK